MPGERKVPWCRSYIPPGQRYRLDSQLQPHHFALYTIPSSSLFSSGLAHAHVSGNDPSLTLPLRDYGIKMIKFCSGYRISLLSSIKSPRLWPGHIQRMSSVRNSIFYCDTDRGKMLVRAEQETRQRQVDRDTRERDRDR